MNPTANDEHGWRTVVVGSATQEGGEVVVGITDQRGNDEDTTFLVTLGHRAHVEQFEMQRLRVLACALRARLVVVETPGFGNARSRLTRPERRALRRGDFTVLGRRILAAALHSVDAEGPSGRLGLLGYSLGASTGTAMAKIANTAESGPRIDTIVLVEPVALHRWGALELWRASRREDLVTQQYLDETATVPSAVQPWDRRPGEEVLTRRAIDMTTMVSALRRPSLPLDLMAATGSVTHPVRRVVLIQGDASALSLHRDGLNLVRSLADRRVPVDFLRVPGTHAFWHSLPRVEELAVELADLLRVDR